MAKSPIPQPNPNLDLVLERVVDVPKELVWKAWTVPEYVKHWFTPAPWVTVECEIDLRPGGLFSTTMRSPDGKLFPNPGCYLEVVPNERLTFTNAIAAGFRPNALPSPTPDDSFYFTAVVSLESHGTGAKYTALVMHADPASRKRHEEMRFYNGWSTALDQLVAFVKTL